MNKVIWVVDDFLRNPDEVRDIALRQKFYKTHSAGVRTKDSFLHLAPYREQFEELVQARATDWEINEANGRFQCCLASDSVPYHSDSQSHAGVLFLTPEAPIKAGLSFFMSKETGLRRRSKNADLMMKTFGGGAEFDQKKWEEVDRIGNVYNRLVIFDAMLAHGASSYFGETIQNGRLFQNFFFNI